MGGINSIQTVRLIFFRVLLPVTFPAKDNMLIIGQHQAKKHKCN